MPIDLGYWNRPITPAERAYARKALGYTQERWDRQSKKFARKERNRTGKSR